MLNAFDALGRRLFGNWSTNTDTYSAKIDIRKGRDSRQREIELRAEILYQSTSQNNLISRDFAERGLLWSEAELSEQKVIILEWTYKHNQYWCKYVSEFELSSEQGFNLIFGPNKTFELPSGNPVNPFEDARIRRRLRKRNSWKHTFSNPAESITKRKTFRGRRSSTRTDSIHHANPPPVTSPVLDKKDEETQTGDVSLSMCSSKQQLQNISTPQVDSFPGPGSSINALETYPYPRTLQVEFMALEEDSSAGIMSSLGSGKDVETPHDSQALTEEAVHSHHFSPLPMERFLESPLRPFELGNVVGLHEYPHSAGVQEDVFSDEQYYEPQTPQTSKKQTYPFAIPPIKYPSSALQGQIKKASDFPDDYWQWDPARKKYYHRDEDSGSVVSYGPLD